MGTTPDHSSARFGKYMYHADNRGVSVKADKPLCMVLRSSVNRRNACSVNRRDACSSGRKTQIYRKVLFTTQNVAAL